MRWTKNPRTALKRVRERWPEAMPTHRKRKAVKTLAVAAATLEAIGVSQAEVRDGIRWHGPIPCDGLSGFQHDALHWARSERNR